jgi:hypothetical protein
VELRYAVKGGDTYVYLNMDDDKIADYSIKLNGEHKLSASDFFL